MTMSSRDEQEEENPFIEDVDHIPTWLTTEQKVLPGASPASKYKSPVLNDVTVYQMAREQQTADFISKFFNISRTTLWAHHQPAFEAGKAAGNAKIKKVLMNIATDYRRKDQIRAVELYMKQYMGLSDNPAVGRNEDGELETKTTYEVEVIKPEDVQ